jgi:hypothetical protein
MVTNTNLRTGSSYDNVGFGSSGRGTVNNLSVGLAFVATLPASGKEGSPVFILGSNLTYTTSATFDSTPAELNVVSSTEIKATVPSGAASDKVKATALLPHLE